MIGFILSLAAVAALQQPAGAPAPPPACSAPEYRQLDFWIGVWDVEVDMGAQGTARGENRIGRGFGGCVIVERFRLPGGLPGGGEFVGGSYSIYDRPTRTWRQMWVDNAGGMFDLRGGPVTGGRHSFELVNIEPRGADGAPRRMIWEDVTENGLVWRWQKSENGAWSDLWVIRYRRRQP